MPRYYNATIRNLEYRLRKFKPVLEAALKDEIRKNESIIVDLIQTQLYMGLDGYGAEITPPYTMTTVKYKKRKHQVFDRVTLRDTGDFYRSLHVVIEDDGFRIVSDDEKAQDLLDRYGEKVLRLMNNSLTEVIRVYLRPALTKRMKEYVETGT